MIVILLPNPKAKADTHHSIPQRVEG